MFMKFKFAVEDYTNFFLLDNHQLQFLNQKNYVKQLRLIDQLVRSIDHRSRCQNCYDEYSSITIINQLNFFIRGPKDITFTLNKPGPSIEP